MAQAWKDQEAGSTDSGKAAERPCMFCGTTTHPKTREHVIHESLGGTLVLKNEVCEACNSNLFAPLDGDFVRYVKDFLNAHHPDVMAGARFLVNGHGVSFDEAHGMWLSVNTDAKGKPVVLTQIVLGPEGRTLTTLDARHEAKAKKYLQDFILSLAQPETLALEPMIVPGVDGLEPAFILSTKGKVALRAKDEETYERLRELVVSGRAGEALGVIPMQMKDQPLTVKRNEQPSPIHKHMTLNLGNIYRSATKVALELACVISDASWLADPCFEQAIAFAMGQEVNLDVFCPVRETRDDVTFPALEGKHLAMVSRMGTNLMVYLMLYQKPGWLIRLTEDLPESFPLDVPAIFLFDYRGRTHRRLDWSSELDEIGTLMAMGALTPPTGRQPLPDELAAPSR